VLNLPSLHEPPRAVSGIARGGATRGEGALSALRPGQAPRPGRGPYRRVTHRRLETFLRELRAGASFRRAAAAASPGAASGATTTFRSAMRADPRLACRVVVARLGAREERHPC